MTKGAKVALGLLVAFALVFTWLVAAMNYGDDVAIGTYTSTAAKQRCVLILRADHSFHQEVWIGTVMQIADGEWRRIGEGGLAFTKEFLAMSGQEKGPDGTSYAEMKKWFGLVPSIVFRQYYVVWYGRSDPGSDAPIEGSYVGDEPGVDAKLTLNSDQSFDQRLKSTTFDRVAHGSWKRLQNGDVTFSRDFLKTSGASLSEDEMASVWNPKGSNLQVEIAIKPSLAAPVFEKKYFK